MSQLVFCGWPCERPARALGLQAHLAGAAAEAFAQGPGIALGFKADLHRGLTHVQARLQGFHGRTRGGCLQEQRPVQRFHQGAFAGFIGPTNQGEPGREVELQVAMEAHVLELAVEETHGDSAGGGEAKEFTEGGADPARFIGVGIALAA